jgi:acyl dehydratase
VSDPSPKKYYWEDFAVGTVREFGGMKLEKADIIRFARDWDPQPFHVDEEAAERSPYGGLIASGWQTCAAAMRMCCDAYLLEAASVGSPGVENIRWVKPVRPGDTLKVRLEVLEARLLKSKPGVGLVKNRWQLFNQHGEEVMQMEGFGMFLQRRAG